MWSCASGVIVITYDDVSVGAAVSVDARRVLRRAAGALPFATAGALGRAAGALGGAIKAEAMPIRAASAARRLTMLSQR